MALHIGIVVGESSGDFLGSDLMAAIARRHPDVRFSGIGGPRMCEQGFESLYSIERLSLMGFVEPLKRLPELLRIRRALRRHFLDSRPDLVVGIDAPDFNLDLELSLRKRGITTAHYVGPTVWAWRRGRIRKIIRAVDMMLTLFPFEADFYQQAGLDVACVGHPLADRIPLADQQAQARQTLGLGSGERIVALLPGSRRSEVAQLGPPFLATAQWLLEREPGLKFLLPAINHERAEQLGEMLRALPEGFPVEMREGDSRLVMAAADAVLTTSGTTTLEAMLLKRPMVVAYRLGNMSFAILSRLIKTDYIALPNLLAGEALVPELMQEDVDPQVMGPLLLRALRDQGYRERLQARFLDMHRDLARDASERAADSLLALLALGCEKSTESVQG